MARLRYIPPGTIVAVLLVLIASQLFFAFLRYRRRAYLPILLMTILGFALGQANLLPALLFALLLQPIARFVPRPGGQTQEQAKEARPSNSNPRT